jgi:hypothetical protein
MISDVLNDAVAAIDDYLESESPAYRAWYSGPIRDRIVNVRNEMNFVRIELDSSGYGDPVPNFMSPEAVNWVDLN